MTTKTLSILKFLAVVMSAALVSGLEAQAGSVSVEKHVKTAARNTKISKAVTCGNSPEMNVEFDLARNWMNEAGFSAQALEASFPQNLKAGSAGSMDPQLISEVLQAMVKSPSDFPASSTPNLETRLTAKLFEFERKFAGEVDARPNRYVESSHPDRGTVREQKFLELLNELSMQIKAGESELLRHRVDKENAGYWVYQQAVLQFDHASERAWRKFISLETDACRDPQTAGVTHQALLGDRTLAENVGKVR